MAVPIHHNLLKPSPATVAHLHHIGTELFVTPTGLFMEWLSLHTHLAYVVLFSGSYFESLVGPSFFIPGEIFLLPGSILAGAGTLNIWFVVLVLYGGAILGDSSSYWIGRMIGTSIFHDRKKFLNFKNYRRIETLLEKYGNSAIFFARFIPPFPKIAPVAAGIFEVPYPTFLMYNIPGIMIGVGQFIAVGYFFGNRYELVMWIVERYTLLLLGIAALIFFMYWYLKKRYKRKEHFDVS
jgi:membrane-associated protein